MQNKAALTLPLIHPSGYASGRKSHARIAYAKEAPEYWQERLYKLNKLLDVIAETDPSEPLRDVYFSLNGFSTHRRTDCLVQINSLFLDLDIHGLFQDPDFVLACVRDLIPQTIPEPNIVVYSGRGLWLIWLIEPVPREAFASWSKLEAHFVKSLAHLGADLKAKDVTRVIRLPGSINGKSGKEVVWEVWHTERYRLNRLVMQYMPAPKPLKPRKERSRPRDETPVHHKMFSPYSLFWAIIEDLKRLADLRGRQLRGHRDYFLFIWRNCLAQMGVTAEVSEIEMRKTALLYLGNDALPDREWTQKTLSVYRATHENADGDEVLGYKLKTSWIVDALAITPEEELQMQVLISRTEKYRRKNVKRRKQTRQEYLSQAEDKRAEILRLRDEHPGLSMRKLAKLANVHVATVSRTLNEKCCK